MFMALTRNVGWQPLHSRADQLMRLLVDKVAVVRSTFPQSAVHVFGAGGFISLAFSLLAGADTVDTTGWRVRAAFGCIVGRSGRHVRLSRLRARGLDLEVSMHDDLMECDCPSCVALVTVRGRARRLAACFSNRALHNFWVIAAQVDRISGQRQRPTKYRTAATRPSAILRLPKSF